MFIKVLKLHSSVHALLAYNSNIVTGQHHRLGMCKKKAMHISRHVQLQLSCKISVKFSASCFCLRSGNVKIVLNNPNPTSSV